MEAKPLEIKATTWSYDKFIDGKIMEEMDKARRVSYLEPIPDKPNSGDLYWSRTKDCFFRYNGERCFWVNTINPDDKYTNFVMKLLYKKDNETKEDRA